MVVRVDTPNGRHEVTLSDGSDIQNPTVPTGAAIRSHCAVRAGPTQRP